MTHHVNDMSVWPEIVCQRGHVFHQSRKVRVDLYGGHGYHDYPQIPRRLARAFDVLLWDTRLTPVDNGPYCPARDALSETILSHGIWEPRETALTLHVCASAEPDQGVIDIGSQIGWFSLLAASCGLPVLAFDADPECVRLLDQSAKLNLWGGLIDARQHRVSAASEQVAPDSPLRLAKIDVEGAEADAVRMLWPAIGNVDHLLIEVSPVFHDGYARILLDLIDAGFVAYRLPPKGYTAQIVDPENQLARLPRDEVEPWVASIHQENVWLRREDATW